MANTLQMYNAGGIPLLSRNVANTVYTPGATDGIASINLADVSDALRAGWVFIAGVFRLQAVTTPAAAAVGAVVASAALSNGTLTVIANKPDVMRQVKTRIDPGTSAITAGTVTNTYVANDGSVTVDVIAMAGIAASTPTTFASSKGVLSMTSSVVAALAGGTSPKVEISTTATLAVPVDPGTVDFAEVFEATDGTANAVGAVAAGGFITPTTAPNGTHSYSLGYTFNRAA